MDAEEFVSALMEATRDSALAEVKDAVRYSPEVMGPASAWYRQLTEEERGRVEVLLRYVADSVLFGTLCVIDGVRSVKREIGHPGRFELYYVSPDETERRLLNSPDEDCLHDIHASLREGNGPSGGDEG